MAEASEAVAATGSDSSYYCHVCNEDISPVLPVSLMMEHLTVRPCGWVCMVIYDLILYDA